MVFILCSRDEEATLNFTFNWFTQTSDLTLIHNTFQSHTYLYSSEFEIEHRRMYFKNVLRGTVKIKDKLSMK